MNLMTNEWSRKPGVFSLFSRIKTPKREIRNNENCPNVTHGKIFGWRSWHTDWAQRGPCVMIESQIFTRPAWPKSVNKHFIIWPLSVENFESFCSTIVGRDTRARGRTTKNILLLKKFSFVFFDSEQINHNSLKTRLCFYPFSFKFLQQSSVSAGPNGFFRIDSRQSVVQTSAFNMVFYGIARAGPYGSYGNYQSFTEVEVNSGGHL